MNKEEKGGQGGEGNTGRRWGEQGGGANKEERGRTNASLQRG